MLVGSITFLMEKIKTSYHRLPSPIAFVLCLTGWNCMNLELQLQSRLEQVFLSRARYIAVLNTARILLARRMQEVVVG